MGQFYITLTIEQEQLLKEWWTEKKTVTCIHVLKECKKKKKKAGSGKKLYYFDPSFVIVPNHT